MSDPTPQEPKLDAGTPLLQVHDLHVTFRSGRDEVRAVDGVNLSIAPGEVLALVGESGCGKTTLIRSIIGLEEPSAGQVEFEGQVVARRDRRRLRRHVQMIFQDPTGALNPRHTIDRAVREGLDIQRVDGDRDALVAEALAQAGLRPAERFVGRFPHEISGGQRQRVIIAGALALGPRLLLADEPVASLDASIRGEILALIRSLVDDHGIAVIAVTHDLGLAWNIADRIAVMYLGRIVEEGSADEVLASPQHPYTQALLSVVPEARDVTPHLLEGETPDARRIPSGCRFHPRCPLLASGEADRLGIADRCRGEDPQLRAVGSGVTACHAAGLVGP